MHRTNPFFECFNVDGKERETTFSSAPNSFEASHEETSQQKGLTSIEAIHAKTRTFSAMQPGARHGRYFSGKAASRQAYMSGASRDDCNIVEPMRMLHKCIRYFASHPEIYGNDLRALLDRELMYVMRVKASETALLTPGTVPVPTSQLPQIVQSKTNKEKLQHPALSKCAGWLVCPRSAETAVSGGAIAGGEGMFGFGSISFMEATPGFLSLLDKNCRYIKLNDEGAQLEKPEDSNISSFPSSSAQEALFQDKCRTPSDVICGPESSHVRFLLSCSQRASRSLNQNSPLVENDSKVLIDGTSYEISFLRCQLQQVEAAFNAKCICLHELQQENSQNKYDLEKTKKKLEEYISKNNEMAVQIESMRRELDAWKQRASELNLLGQRSSSHDPKDLSRRMHVMQLGDVKRELLHMSRLWRETEKSLQETRRTLESAEKESQVSHRYLEDAFKLIERLERRIVRRDNYIATQQKRFLSMEEKYKKLMWCYEELQTMKGAHSYIDFLLASDPIWSLFLFVRLQRRFMGFSYLEEPVPIPFKPLYFSRSPFGGKLRDAYSQDLIYRLVSSDILGEGKKDLESFSEKNLEVNLLRWRGLYAISHPSALNNFSPVSDGIVSDAISKKFFSVPVLTLASLLLPRQLISAEGEVSLEYEDVANSAQYDQTTLRLLLYSFWGKRMQEYKMEMKRRLHEMRKSNFNFQKGFCGDADVVVGEGGRRSKRTSSATNVTVFRRPLSFLAALVDFLRSLYPISTKSAKPDSPNKPVRLVVCGVLPKLEKQTEDMRMFFSSIFDIMEDGTEVPVELSHQARELLYALYYYAEEYKEVDADFRLFYLVAHQQIPEIIAINFFASMEALRKSCEETLCNRLSLQQGAEEKLHLDTDGSSVLSETQVPDEPLLNETPYNALKKVVEIIDKAPLVDEDTCIEPDSDGEGFGLILPGTNKSPTTQKGQQDVFTEVVPPDFNSLKHNIYQYLYCSDENTSGQTAMAEFVSKDIKQGDGFVNNSVNVANDGGDNAASATAAGGCGGGNKAKNKKLNLFPTPWVTLDERIGALLGPHTSLLDAFKTCQQDDEVNTEKNKVQKIYKESGVFSAARGLLSLEDIISLIHKHCFATYLVSCCGMVSSSFLETLLLSANLANCDDDFALLDPLTIIGYFSFTEVQMKRLRFAIAMDQPSSLVRYANLFDVNSRDGMPSHFYNEYLQLILDTFMEQQEAFMNVIQTSITVQQNFGSGGILAESVYQVSFPALRTSIASFFRHLLLDSEQCNSFAKHLLDYCEMLRCEEDVRHEQFRDAVFFINTPSLSQQESEVEFSMLFKKRWPVEVEAASCSLLHLSFAIRMTYIVWGFHSTPSARLAKLLIPLAAKWQEEDEDGMFFYNAKNPNLSEIKEDSDFIEDVKKEYFDAVRRVNSGMTLYNNLRRLVTTAPATEGSNTPASPKVVITSPSATVVSETAVANVPIDFSSLCALWDYEQRAHFDSLMRSEKRAGSFKKKKSFSKLRSSVGRDVLNQVYMPGVASIFRFFKTYRLNVLKGDKKGKSKGANSLSDIRTALLNVCAFQDSKFASHHVQLIKFIVDASKKLDFLSLSTMPEMLFVDEKRHGNNTATTQITQQEKEEEEQQISRSGNVFVAGLAGNNDGAGAVDKAAAAGGVVLKEEVLDVALRERNRANNIQENINNAAFFFENISLQHVHVGCATLSLM